MAATPKKPGARKGGARPGAGRPSKAEAHATPIKDAEKQICDRLPLLIERLFILAEGVVVQEESVNGDVDVYQKPPDPKALIYLVDRVMGKPTQPVAGDDAAAPLRIKVEYQDPEPKPDE